MGVGTRGDVVVQLLTSIGNEVAVSGARGPGLPDEPFEVRERFRDGEPPLRRAQLFAEDAERDLVRGAAVCAQRGGGSVEAGPVMFAQLAGPSGDVFDRLAVSGIDDARAQLDRALERRQVVAERVGTTLRVETAGRRDVSEQVVARDERAVA